MNIIFGNYGNGTIALIEWAASQGLDAVHVVSVNTGFAARGWAKHVECAQQFARNQHFTVIELNAKRTFSDLVRARDDFPSTKFQWCPLLLKGVPFLEWLDELDPNCEATIYLAKRRSVFEPDLAEWVESSEHYGDRQLRYPLYLENEAAIHARVHQAGFEPLAHRSLECEPCIHNQTLDFQRLNDEDMQRLEHLESTVGKTMFDAPIRDKVFEARKMPAEEHQALRLGCADPYHCGD